MRRGIELAFIAVALTGCASRAHLTETQGRSYHAFFQRQAPPQAKISGPVSGLDSQEATIIAESYRRSLAPRQVAQQRPDQILLVGPQPLGGAAPSLMPPAPSVPRY
jgi:hypothetical protein